MKIKVRLVSLLSLMLAQSIFAANYKLDESHSQLGFKVRHLGISNVKGHFKKFTGNAIYDEKTGKMSKLSVNIIAKSIDTNEPDRDKHLRSKDFFEVKKYKHLKFVSSKVIYRRNKPSRIRGMLTIKGVTLPVTLKIEDWGGTAVDPWKNKRLAFEASAKIDRRKFGLTWNKGLAQVAGVMVGNEVTLLLEIEAIGMD